MHTPHFRTVRAEVDREKLPFHGGYASDHYLLLADLAIEGAVAASP